MSGMAFASSGKPGSKGLLRIYREIGHGSFCYLVTQYHGRGSRRIERSIRPDPFDTS
jgi:hypothetical protein